MQNSLDFSAFYCKKVELVKISNHSISQGLRYFHEKYNLPGVQIVKDLKREKIEKGIDIVEGLCFLKSLYL